MPITAHDILMQKELARRGARVRLSELAAEMRWLLTQYPELRHAEHSELKQAREGEPAYVQNVVTQLRTPRKRRKMGDAARKKVSLRMKAYWAARRKQKGKK